MEFVKIEFRYTNQVTVINEEQFDVHMRLYEGYINKMNEIDQLLSDGGDMEEANATYSKFRGIKRGETFALNGVILHELYFQNIGGNQMEPELTLMGFLQRDYAKRRISYKSNEVDFVNCTTSN